MLNNIYCQIMIIIQYILRNNIQDWETSFNTYLIGCSQAFVMGWGAQMTGEVSGTA